MLIILGLFYLLIIFNIYEDLTYIELIVGLISISILFLASFISHKIEGFDSDGDDLYDIERF